MDSRVLWVTMGEGQSIVTVRRKELAFPSTCIASVTREKQEVYFGSLTRRPYSDAWSVRQRTEPAWINGSSVGEAPRPHQSLESPLTPPLLHPLAHQPTRMGSRLVHSVSEMAQEAAPFPLLWSRWSWYHAWAMRMVSHLVSLLSSLTQSVEIPSVSLHAHAHTRTHTCILFFESAKCVHKHLEIQKFRGERPHRFTSMRWKQWSFSWLPFREIVVIL